MMYGLIWREGQEFSEGIPDLFDLWGKVQGWGSLFKTIEFHLTLYEEGEHYEETISLPVGIYAIWYNQP
ncbi:hypothetical protein ACFL4G_03970 [Thermodesulfobacteriota bacterium]